MSLDSFRAVVDSDQVAGHSLRGAALVRDALCLALRHGLDQMAFRPPDATVTCNAILQGSSG